MSDVSPAALVARRLRDATLAAASAAGIRPVLLIDGGSGAGKTTLAEAVAAAWPEAALVQLDDLYPGWSGLEAGSSLIATSVLGEASGYLSWDWEHSAPGGWRVVPREGPLIIEGSGALSVASRARAAYAVWLEVDAATRRDRALARDGATFEPHWDDWARQEERFRHRERPDSLADEVLGLEGITAPPRST